MAVNRPEPLLIYIPGVERDRRCSVLMELELAGNCYEPQLKRLARNVLRERYTDGVIDEMLRPEKLAYADIVALLDQGSAAPAASLLRVIFESARENHDLIAAWLASPEKDQAIRDKEATSELLKLIEHRLGVKGDTTSRTGIRPGQDSALRADQRVPRRPDHRAAGDASDRAPAGNPRSARAAAPGRRRPCAPRTPNGT